MPTILLSSTIIYSHCTHMNLVVIAWTEWFHDLLVTCLSSPIPLPSTDHVSRAVYRRQFATQHYQFLYFLIVLRLISSFNSCGVCDSEQTPI